MDKTKKVYTSFLYRLKPAQMMVLGFGSVILIGALLLMTPLATNSGNSTSFIDCLFTATSAVCVTGLIVVDTSMHWSIFGKVVIILLIQIGGLGFMAISASIAIIFGKKINLRQRILIKEALNQNHLSGSVRLIMTVIKFTFIIEAVGALLLSTVFIPQFGLVKGIGFSVFHAISGFCNAGFDLMGQTTGAYSSITSYYNNPIVVFTISALIILGGIGFGVMVCVVGKKKFRDYDLSSKLAIITTLILLLAGTALIFFGEYTNTGTLANLNMWDKFQVSFFQSVTTRTAGYTTIDFTQLREATLFVMIILMFIGASPASTGGGIKTTTVAIIVMAVKSFVKDKNEITVFKKSINKYTFRKALGVFVIAVVTVVTSTYLLTITQGGKFNLLSSAFEVASAFATVGLSLAGSYNLNLFGKILIIFLMFAGRVGSLTVFTIFLHEPEPDNVRYPEGKVLVG
ncbi:ATP synthase subunit J [Peptostreptococcus russellii]|uniref:ATP synthase subunit J n=1 Tax=Peptostreptococcus russellii TaxID=215200 RepID=A0A2P7Q0T3_9FIRM|nr:TrkH family potassium uptake protein [Peptostreptococcus russellii]PSJ31566.1 ATP synthase subunit J [Peptostreptococcus russellii]